MAKRNLTQAATLLPLAIGLAMNGAPSSSKTPTHETTGRTVARQNSNVRPHTGQPFVIPEGCTVPFDGSSNPDIDPICPIDGGSTSAAKRAQSRAKNNLCVATKSVQRITYDQIKQMQQHTNSVNVSNLIDRSPLTAQGEGKYVEYVAFIQDAHYSDVASGEAVNCNISGNSTNDIHIVLVQDPNDDACTSTTAEMIPHFRPLAWTDTNVNSVKEHPVRIRGPLFYDDAHKPCSGTSRPNPNRVSLWEIHPVYSLDVCRMTDLGGCQNSISPGDWVSLEDWLKEQH